MIGLIAISPTTSLQYREGYSWVVRSEEAFAAHLHISGTSYGVHHTIPKSPRIQAPDPTSA